MDDYIDTIFNEDCATGLRRIPDRSIDLIVMDPPYEMETCGGGAFGSDNRTYHGELNPISKGITDELLDAIVSKMRKVNIYIWCNKNQIYQYLRYFNGQGGDIMYDILTWHKTNPVPTCGNKYLSDTEYCLFFREKGVRVYGTYETKCKYYVSSLNTDDKKLYNHPTVKPLNIIRNLITNSLPPKEEWEGGIPPMVMDPFMGSGTTAVAAKQLGFRYTGFEIDPGYHETASKRIAETVPDAQSPIPGRTNRTLESWGASP